MTNQEAIEVLQKAATLYEMDYPMPKPVKEALAMAIQALQDAEKHEEFKEEDQ